MGAGLGVARRVVWGAVEEWLGGTLAAFAELGDAVARSGRVRKGFWSQNAGEALAERGTAGGGKAAAVARGKEWRGASEIGRGRFDKKWRA